MDLVNQQAVSTDYAALVARLRQGEVIECVISSGVWEGMAVASYTEKWYGDMFEITIKEDSDVIMISSECKYMEFCRDNGVIFEAKDFLGSTRKMLEIARNAAKFKAISVPFNTPEDIDALLVLMSANESVR